MHFGFALDLPDIDLLNIDLLDQRYTHLDLLDQRYTHLDLLDTYIPSKHFVCPQVMTSSRHVFKTSSRRLQQMSSRRLQGMSSRCLQDMPTRRLQPNNFSPSRCLARCLQKRLQDVFKMSSQVVFKTQQKIYGFLDNLI